MNSSDGFLRAKRDHLRRELPWRVPSQGELYESTVENLWNSQGESKTMDGERIYIVLFPGLYHHTVLNCLSIYKNGGARPGLFWNVYLGRHRHHTPDKMDQASPSFFFFCILQAIKTGQWEGLGVRLGYISHFV